MNRFEHPPIDVDVNDLDPGEFARLQVSRVVADNNLALAELHWDAARYQRGPDLVLMLASFVGQLLTMLAASQGKTAVQLWQEWMLDEAACR